MFQTFTLDKSLLGQKSSWTNVPWTKWSLDNCPLDKCINTEMIGSGHICTPICYTGVGGYSHCFFLYIGCKWSEIKKPALLFKNFNCKNILKNLGKFFGIRGWGSDPPLIIKDFMQNAPGCFLQLSIWKYSCIHVKAYIWLFGLPKIYSSNLLYTYTVDQVIKDMIIFWN